MKTCTGCKKEKDESLFFNRRGGGLYAKCKQCKKELLYKWREKNKNKWVAYVREKSKTEKYKAVRKAYNQLDRVRAKNLQKYRAPEYQEKKKQYLLDNPEKAKAYDFNRNKRRRIRVADNNLSDRDLLEIREAYGDKCSFCGFPADTLDHILPLCRNGTHTVDNLWPACRSCNSQKGGKTVLEYYDWLLMVDA